MKIEQITKNSIKKTGPVSEKTGPVFYPNSKKIRHSSNTFECSHRKLSEPLQELRKLLGESPV